MMEQREMETMVKQAYKRMTRLCSRGEYCVFDIRQKLRGLSVRHAGGMAGSGENGGFGVPAISRRVREPAERE